MDEKKMEEMEMEQPIQLSGVYGSTVLYGQGHTVGRLTMSTDEIRERLEGEVRGGNLTMVDMKAIEVYLKKVEYRKEYNQKPEVKARRKEYMAKRNEEAKAGRQLLKSLLGR